MPFHTEGAHCAPWRPSSRTNKMTVNSELIVLNVTKFRENSIVLHCLTKEWGRVGLMVSTKGHNSYFQPMNILEADVTVNPRTTLWHARNFSICSPLVGIRSDLKKNSITMFMSEVLFKTVKETGSDTGIYDLCRQSVFTLDALETDFSNFHLYFLLELAAALGFSPDFDSLAPFAGDNLMKLEAMMQCNLAESLLIPMNGTERSEIAESIIRYIAFHSESPVNIKSLAVLRELSASAY